jgi:hypothetical protein
MGEPAVSAETTTTTTTMKGRPPHNGRLRKRLIPGLPESSDVVPGIGEPLVKRRR